jgi:hypothetical protein
MQRVYHLPTRRLCETMVWCHLSSLSHGGLDGHGDNKKEVATLSVYPRPSVARVTNVEFR